MRRKFTLRSILEDCWQGNTGKELPTQEIKELLCLCIMEQYVIVQFYAIFSKLSFTAQMDPQLCSVLSSIQHCVIIS